jgi:protein SCO1/2
VLRRAVAFVLVALVATGFAQKGANAGGVVRADNLLITDQMGIDQKLGNQVPGDVIVQESDGRKIRFGDLYGTVPLVVMPMFNQCNGICIIEQDSLMKTLSRMKEPVGEQFKVVMLSIHPKETPELALSKKHLVLDRYNGERERRGYPKVDTSAEWHYLTADWKSIQRLTDALGFRFTYNERTGNINHPAGIMILTPDGKVSSYIYGKDYPTRILQEDVRVAREGRVGEKAEVILLGCIRIDPHTGQKTLIVENVLRVAGVATVVVLATSIIVMNRKYKYHGGPV